MEVTAVNKPMVVIIKKMMGTIGPCTPIFGPTTVKYQTW